MSSWHLFHGWRANSANALRPGLRDFELKNSGAVALVERQGRLDCRRGDWALNTRQRNYGARRVMAGSSVLRVFAVMVSSGMGSIARSPLSAFLVFWPGIQLEGRVDQCDMRESLREIPSQLVSAGVVFL